MIDNILEIVQDDVKFNYIMQIPEKYDNYKSRCKMKKIQFNLSFSLFDSLVKRECHYCKYKSESKINGIDRVDPTKGYTKLNCVPCCWTCNRAKSNMSYKDFQNYIARFK